MAIAANDEVTAGQAARELALSMEAFLELAYSGAVTTTIDPRSGRMMVRRAELERVRAERETHQTSP